MWEMLLPLLGVLIGTIAALTGIGGGIFIIPLLTLLYAFSPTNAAGISFIVIVFTAIVATLNFSKQKRISYKTGLLLALVTTPGGLLGVYMTTAMSANMIGLLFGFFSIIFVAIPMSITTNFPRIKISANIGSGKFESKSSGMSSYSMNKVMLCLILSYFAGIVSGLLGIGCGLLMVPILIFVADMPIHLATATSMFSMIFTSSSEAMQHYFYFANQTNLLCALLLILGTTCGACIGVYASKKISGKNLSLLFCAVLAIVGIIMILKYI